jgi:hypothetical protein
MRSNSIESNLIKLNDISSFKEEEVNSYGLGVM